MQRSLTVLLPVHNAQSTLADTVAEVLEVVAELTERFELVIVDDGSADATSEIAHDLSRDYPQVTTVCHGEYLGREAAIRTGLQHSSGEIVFLRDEHSGLAIDGVPKLWRAACEHGTKTDRPDTPTDRKWARFSTRHATRRAGYQMIDRRTMENVHGLSKPIRPNFLAKLREFTLGE